MQLAINVGWIRICAYEGRKEEGEREPPEITPALWGDAAVTSA
jgi:hypothetical protein